MEDRRIDPPLNFWFQILLLNSPLLKKNHSALTVYNTTKNEKKHTMLLK